MKRHVAFSLCCVLVSSLQVVVCSDVFEYEFDDYVNRTEPALQQLYQFRKEHPRPIGILTTGSGKLVEIRETVALNSDPFKNLYHVDIVSHGNDERIPERVVHAKGAAALGYFEVTHDVSKYTKADVFNGVGKKTQLVGRFSTALQSKGGNDASREMKGLAMKFYTKEGNLDLLCIHFPVYFYRDPNDFMNFVHAFKRNPKTGLRDLTAGWDFVTKRPDTLHAFFWFLSDHGIPNGYRKMDNFPVHTYEVHNKHGDRYFVKFNFRSEQGIENLSNEEAAAISAKDLDYYNRDLYNAIEEKNYPAWKLEMDIMTPEDIKNLDYNPFQINIIWKKGTYFTVPVGRVVFNRNPDNEFAVSEQSAFSPARLVPGIPGPIDVMFRTRRQSYRDTQIYRLSVNHNKIAVNAPLYAKTYLRDGKPPVGDNGRDAPNYYPNSFNGPIPFVDPSQPKEKFTLLESNAVDLEPAASFYNDYLDDDEKTRFINTTVQLLVPIPPFLQRRAIRLLTLTDADLGRRVATGLEIALSAPPPPPPKVLIPKRCIREEYYSLKKIRQRIPKSVDSTKD